MTACISDLHLDELLAGELAGDTAAAVTDHMSGCERCRDRERVLSADRAQFRAAAPRLRRGRPWIAVAGTMVAAAAAAVFVLRAPVDTTRTKGGARLGFVVARGDTMVMGGAGERVHPGDTLSYLVSAPQPSYVAVLSRDPAGRITAYFPAGDRAQWVPAGREVQLPIATQMDGSLGRERLVGVFCDRPVEVEQLSAALDDAPPAGCTADRIDLEKVP
jgi:hypothetical protein